MYEKDPQKDSNPLPHLFEYKGKKHYIFNTNKLEENKEYPFSDGFYVKKKKKGGQIVMYKYITKNGND